MDLLSLETKRSELQATIEQAEFNEADLEAIRSYADEIRQGLDIANASFEGQRWLIEKLDAKATLTVEDGERIAYAECRLGEIPERLPIASYKSCFIITPGRE